MSRNTFQYIGLGLLIVLMFFCFMVNNEIQILKIQVDYREIIPQMRKDIVSLDREITSLQRGIETAAKERARIVQEINKALANIQGVLQTREGKEGTEKE